VTTSANQEDHVSMGLAAARKARQSLACLEHVVAAELLCASQGLDFRRPLRSSAGVERIHAAVRAEVPTLHEDRVLGPDLEKITTLIRTGAFSRLVEGAMES
jgi:histidine ammonia-lyase